MFKYDSTHGPITLPVEGGDAGFFVDGKKVETFECREPSDIPWGSQVLICTALKPYKTNRRSTIPQILMVTDSTEMTKPIKILREN